MPGTPLTLSTVSPMSASTSITCSGATPNFRKIGRHRRARGFVVGHHLRAERRLCQIEGSRDVRRLMVRDEFSKHGDEAVDGVRRSTVGPGQAAYRVIRAVHLVTAIDQEQGGTIRHGGTDQYIIQVFMHGPPHV